MSDRLHAAEEALRKVQAHVAALEGLSEELSLSVHALEAELGALGEQVRAEAQRRSSAASDEQSTRSAGAQATQATTRSADAEGARLVALNMALEGKPRDETDRYLAEHFDIADRETLLDDVYAATGR